MEDQIRRIVENALVKSIDIHNVENESFICSIETNVDVKENMILNFKVKSNREYNFKYRNYKTVVKRIELNAIVDSAYDNETLECYVEIISID